MFIFKIIAFSLLLVSIILCFALSTYCETRNRDYYNMSRTIDAKKSIFIIVITETRALYLLKLGASLVAIEVLYLYFSKFY